MANRMKSGGSNDLNRIKIDTQKFSFNMDIVEATARKQADFKEDSIASKMNSGGYHNLNCIRIDPRTGEKFSFNVDGA